MHLKLHLIFGLVVVFLLTDGQRLSRRGPGGRRSYSFSRRPGGHRYRLGGIHYRRHGPYSSRYRSSYYGRYYSHRPGLYRRTARTSYAPLGACTISFYDFYRPPEDVVCRSCISLNYEFCIYEYNCYGTGIWGRSRSGRSRHRSYRSRIYSRGRLGRRRGPGSLADTVCALCRWLYFDVCQLTYCYSDVIPPPAPY